MTRVYEVKPEVETPSIVAEPFKRKYLDEEREESTDERLNVRINKEDREVLNELKNILTFGSDAAIMKQAIRVYLNVINQNFGSDLMKRISTQDRIRPTPKELKQNQ